MTDPTALDSEFLFELARVEAGGLGTQRIAKLRAIAKKLQRLEMFLDDMKPVRVRERARPLGEILGDKL
jgi:hypothetical protein